MRRARTLGRIFGVGGFLLCAGCAQNIANPTGDATRVVAQLGSRDSKPYTLQTSSGQKLDTVVSRGQELVFTLPLEEVGSACLQVVDAEGEAVPIADSARSSFENRTWLEYLEVRRDLQAVELGESKRLVILDRVRRRQEESEARLKSNVAYKDGQCVKPAMGRLPERPSTACAADEAKEVASALCLASSGLSGACSLAANAFGSSIDVDIANFLTTPACGKLVADYLGEAYTAENFFGDLALGIGTDWAEEMLRSDSLLANFIGVLGLVAIGAVEVERFNSCVARASDICHGKYRTWEAERARVTELPNRMLADCTVDTAWARWASSVVGTQAAGLKEHQKELAGVEDRLKEVEARRLSGLPPCRPAAAVAEAVAANGPTAPVEPPIAYRIGFSGRDTESFRYGGKKYDGGVEIVDVTPDMPAAAAGLQPGDVLFRVDEETVRGMDFFIDYLHRREGRELNLSFLRDGRLKAAKMRPVAGRFLLGLQIKDTLLGPQVTEVTRGMPAAQAGLRVGDYILLADQDVVSDTAQLQRRLFESKGLAVALMYYRDKEASLVAVAPSFVADK